MRILVADDYPMLARSLGRWLGSWGYDAEFASDGLEAWRTLKRADAPRICILDWDMPGLSGVEVCRMLRGTPHGGSVFVLMLTARQEKTDVVQALESGADDFLSKPFHPRELQLRLAKGVRDAAAAPAPLATTDGAAAHAGATLGGKVRLEREIGRGAMGSVWLGVHLSLGVNVAVKFMDKTLAETSEYASFDREARAAAQLRSEHIVRIYDHGIARDGLPYLVMEYLDGESLSARIARRGRLSAAEVEAVVSQVARALAEAHARGLVHRDVKPDNIILMEDPDRRHGFSCKLIDFGLAKRYGPQESDAPVAGTPCYMSPEYLRAESPANALLDLWALAVSAFEAITGVVPFDGHSLPEVYQKICVAPLPVPSRVCAAVPPAFDAWFARACARDPKARFGSAAELAAGLPSAPDV